MNYVEIAGLTKRFGETGALQSVDLSVRQGEFFTLLGPSGCGKSTLLRCIAGIETPDAGRISVNGRVLSSPSENILLAPHERKISLVFQSYALWPHMSVSDNIAYGLRRARGHSRRDIAASVNSTLDMLGLTGLGARYPGELSGGQRQRVALARAIIYRSDLLLLDEPLSNLDTKLRERARTELKRVQGDLELTVIYVTHSQAEALSMSDRIAVMNNGQVLQVDDPRTIYADPVSEIVANFAGGTNFLSGTVVQVTEDEVVCMFPALDSQCVALPASGMDIQIGDTVRTLIRPEDLRLAPVDGESTVESLALRARLSRLEYLGAQSLGELETAGGTFRMVIDKTVESKIGPVTVYIRPSDIKLLRESRRDKAP